jgi:hypothetical protein
MRIELGSPDVTHVHVVTAMDGVMPPHDGRARARGRFGGGTVQGIEGRRRSRGFGLGGARNQQPCGQGDLKGSQHGVSSAFLVVGQ